MIKAKHFISPVQAQVCLASLYSRDPVRYGCKSIEYLKMAAERGVSLLELSKTFVDNHVSEMRLLEIKNPRRRLKPEHLFVCLLRTTPPCFSWVSVTKVALACSRI